MNKLFKLKDKQDVEDFVRGCSFYGTGGGGDYAIGVDAMMKQLEKGHEIGWCDPYSLNDEDYSCCPFLMGSIAPEDPEVIRKYFFSPLTSRMISPIFITSLHFHKGSKPLYARNQHQKTPAFL